MLLLLLIHEDLQLVDVDANSLQGKQDLVHVQVLFVERVRAAGAGAGCYGDSRVTDLGEKMIIQITLLVVPKILRTSYYYLVIIVIIIVLFLGIIYIYMLVI